MTNTANCKREAGQDLQHQKREKGFYIELKKKMYQSKGSMTTPEGHDRDYT